MGLKKQKNDLIYKERLQIWELLKSGHSCGDIAKVLFRGKNTVVFEVRRNGGKDAYDPIEAHNKAQQRKLDRYESLKTNYEPDTHPMTRIKNKIEALEMQVEILLDLIKGMK